ncbi:MAG: molybdopterin biosynthesis protein, partial [Isosphaeraceae bacterium]
MPREQHQFLDVLDREAAAMRWRRVLHLDRLEAETVPLAEALGRVLAEDVAAGVDVPAFDRSNVDGYALRAEDTYGASEDAPRRLALNAEELPTGVAPRLTVAAGTATAIATGAICPRGADSVLMVEHARVDGASLVVVRPVAPGANVSFAGTDMAMGERVLRLGTRLTARETGVLAAIGRGEVSVV